jgi:UrcA family protein
MRAPVKLVLCVALREREIMNRERFLLRSKQAVLTSGAALVAASSMVVGPATALPADLTVLMPHVVRQEVARTHSGIPIEKLSLAREVDYGDLDLTTQSGVASLKGRIAATARQACAQLDALYPPTLYPPESTDQDCVKSAVNGGMAQATTAIGITGMAAQVSLQPSMTASSEPVF